MNINLLNTLEYDDLTIFKENDKSGWIEFIKSKRMIIIEFFVTFALFFGRFLYYGWQYFPQADDYIQYHNYSSYATNHYPSLWYFITQRLGLLVRRPLAAIADVYVISKVFSSLIIAVLAISLLYTASAVILRYIFNKLYGTGYMFTVVFCLVPLSFEGLYWISASSRIVPSIFFGSLSALFLYKTIEKKKMRYVPLFIIFQIISFGYYEQTAVLAMGLSFVIALSKRNKYSFNSLFVFFNFTVHTLYTKIAGIIWPNGIYENRSQIALPFITKDYFSKVLPDLTKQLSKILKELSPGASIDTIRRGGKIILSDKAIIYIAFVILMCTATVFFLLKVNTDKTSTKMQTFLSLIFGIFLMLCPLAPFFILRSNYIPIRAIAPCLCGAALIIDTLFRLITRNKRLITVPLLTVIVFIACIASVSELHDYREIYNYDNEICIPVIEAVNKSNKSGSNIAYLSKKSNYTGEENNNYKKHVWPCTSSTWAFTGLLRCRSHNGDFPDSTYIDLKDDGILYTSAYYGTIYRIENFDRVYISSEHGTTETIPIKTDTLIDINTGNQYEVYILYDEYNNKIAQVKEYENTGTIEFY